MSALTRGDVAGISPFVGRHSLGNMLRGQEACVLRWTHVAGSVRKLVHSKRIEE